MTRLWPLSRRCRWLKSLRSVWQPWQIPLCYCLPTCSIWPRLRKRRRLVFLMATAAGAIRWPYCGISKRSTTRCPTILNRAFSCKRLSAAWTWIPCADCGHCFQVIPLPKPESLRPRSGCAGDGVRQSFRKNAFISTQRILP